MIKIICVGNIKEKYLTEAINDYKHRLNKYTKLEIIELESSNYDDINKNIKEEAKKIKKNIDTKDHIISLDIEGKEMDSIQLSKQIENSFKNITFIIGGSNGLDKSVKDMSNDILSFSSFTFPHQLFRVLVLEQIYRSYKIIKNETYHK